MVAKTKNQSINKSTGGKLILNFSLYESSKISKHKKMKVTVTS